MKKLLLTLMMAFLLVVPVNMYYAEENSEYTSLNLDKALTEEAIEHDFSNYKETDDQAIIYLFRGKGCGYCRAFLTYINSLVAEHGKKFKVVSYEVWNDANNADLLDQVSDFLDKPAGGVPYIIIGDKVFAGYSSSYDSQILSAINKLYETDPKDRYDVFEEMKKGKKEDNTSSTLVIIMNLVFTVIATTTIIVVYTVSSNSKQEKLLTRLNEIEKKLAKSETVSTHANSKK